MKTRRKLKGMTLIEVVVSIGVYATIGLLMTEIMSLVNATMQSTAQLNRRLSYEAKFADNLMTDAGGGMAFSQDTVALTLTPADGSGGFEVHPNGIIYETNETNMMTEGGVQHRDAAKEQNAMQLAQGAGVQYKSVNYRFMSFPKNFIRTPAPADVFELKLNIDSGSIVNKISKVQIAATQTPAGGFFVKNIDGMATNSVTSNYISLFDADAARVDLDSSDGSVYEESVFMAEDGPPKVEKTVGKYTPVPYANLETKNGGSNLFTLGIPVTSDGHYLNDDPYTKTLGGTVYVLIYQTIDATNGSPFEWYNTFKSGNDSDVGWAIRKEVLGDPDFYGKHDSTGFPAAAVLKLDFIFSTPNPKTNEPTYFDSVTYRWNPSKGVDSEDYLIAEPAHGIS